MRLITPEIAEYFALRVKPWWTRTVDDDLIAEIPRSCWCSSSARA